MLRVRGPSVASRGGGEADLKDDRLNEENLLLIFDAKEMVVDLTGTPRATETRNSKFLVVDSVTCRAFAIEVPLRWNC